jgi:hypothetical protein
MVVEREDEVHAQREKRRHDPKPEGRQHDADLDAAGNTRFDTSWLRPIVRIRPRLDTAGARVSEV